MLAQLHEYKKHIVVGTLLYAAGMTYFCPCPKLLGCHQKAYIIPVGLASAWVVYGWRPGSGAILF